MELRKTKVKAIIFLSVASFTEAIFGIYIGKIVDSISRENTTIFVESLVITLVIIFLNLVFSILARSNIYKNSCKKAEQLKNKIYNKELNKGRQEGFDIANFTSKIDLVYTDDFLNRWFILESACTFLFSVIAVISINWVMFFVAIAVSMVPMLVPRLLKKYVQNATTSYSEGTTQYANYVSDTLQGRLEILKYQVVKNFLNKHESVNKAFEAKRFKARSANYNASMTANAVGNSMFLFVFLSGGILAFNGLISIGGVIGIIQLMNNIVNPIVNIASRKNEINACSPVLSELNADVERSQNKIERLSEDEINNITLSVNELVYSYTDTDIAIINRFSHDFKKGKKYLIQGESGSGKTTLGKLLSGELKAQFGEISISGKSIDYIDRNQLLKIISYVDQKTYVFEDTVFNNIDMYRGLSQDKILCEMNNMAISNLEHNKVIDDTNGISGGQKSRICLARAIIKLPEILIVDEPTSALDSKNTKIVMQYLCSLSATVIIIAHHLEEELINLFDDIIIL